MDCRQCGEVVFLYIDREMAADLEAPFQDHLAHCPLCATEVDRSRKLLVIVRQRCTRQAAPPSLRVRILTSLPHRRGWA